MYNISIKNKKKIQYEDEIQIKNDQKLRKIPIEKRIMSNQHLITIDGIDIYFPYRPYPQQIMYMSKVIQSLNQGNNSLLQSPTGTGKTLCLLCATIAWLKKYREQNQENIDNVPPKKIVYSSRTHSQIQQVVKELKQTIYRPRITVLASRDQYCLKKEYQNLTDWTLISYCQKAINEHSCKFYQKNHENLEEIFSTDIMDIEELRQNGQKNGFCPYFHSRRVKDCVDIIFMPYNYIFDNQNASPFNIELTNSILIFDEAHNIAKIAEESTSFSITIKNLEAIETEIKLLREIIQSYKDPNTFRQKKESHKNKINKLQEIDTQGLRSSNQDCDLILQHILPFKKYLQKFIENIQKNPENSETIISKEGRDIFQILENNTIPIQLQENTLDTYFQENNNTFQQKKEGLKITNLQEYIKKLVMAIEDLSTTQNYGLDKWMLFLSKVQKLLCVEKVEPENEQSEIYMQCLDPSVSFSFIKIKNPHSILLTSGTLAPFDSWELELKIPFPIILNNQHVIDNKKNLLAGICIKGPLEQELEFTYQNRQKNLILDDVGLTLLNLCKFIPNGILVIFNSSSSYWNCRKQWENGEHKIMNKLKEHKQLFFEPKNSYEMNSFMKNYTQAAKSKQGAILFAICRGKVSEGIDFYDELARAVFLIGVPYPPQQQFQFQQQQQQF
ncbi:regulator of telomere elongation helicase 1, putative [Ichthyophthirius multifiliis]|uniref:Regulator of telomere elongation helicase 1, putative n=1 Tax=Ichthyophthirius multifiliis TaxID=5932 RepID=G0QXH5_ICHMU|nr:regulator of telomere elongation helicase 1, putative [Ichthyophthirius multifiliis]EGR30093.1 regulator of telomere elongation helicase 1, putative [Ichthyophthirius multifiliis]|eukprot:XP_004031329.1 regulator of telomere elongation helicase 1, putative [Ichthyophthirius multifiliis]